jgi:hypothetical protein
MPAPSVPLYLKERFGLDYINVEALPLQKLRRISTTPVAITDFSNPEDLDKHARSFLRHPEEAGETGEGG